MIQASYSSTNVLNEIEWHSVLVNEDKFDYLTEDPDLAHQRAQEGIDQGWVTLLEL